MNPFSILLIGLAMSTDAFAAAVGKGAAMRHPRWRDALRAGLIFGVIEAITPLIGWLLGSAAAHYITAWDHWIAFGVLGLLGAHMIWNGLKPPWTSCGIPRRTPSLPGIRQSARWPAAQGSAPYPANEWTDRA